MQDTNQYAGADREGNMPEETRREREAAMGGDMGDAGMPGTGEMPGGEETPNMGWYIIHTFSGYEDKVKTDLEKTIQNLASRGDRQAECFGQVMIPCQEGMVEDKRPGKKNSESPSAGEGKKTRKVRRKLYPSYVFVYMKLTEATWFTVRNIRGVTGFVGADPTHPEPLSDEEVVTMFAEMGREATDIGIQFKVDDLVRYKDDDPPYPGVHKIKSIDYKKGTFRFDFRHMEITDDLSKIRKAD